MKLPVFYILLLLVVLQSCAQMAVPTGGEKDRTPPALVEEQCVPRNGSTMFNGKKIRLEFDEYIKLNNPQQQVLISPSLNGAVKYVQKGKTLELELPGELMPNTTYTLFFGQAVADITEGNIAAELQFVFSTGPILDSLMVTGKVQNAFTSGPEKGVLVGLYADDDSAFYNQKPRYLAITDPAGVFRIKNVSGGTFRLYALRDLNGNLMYDLPGEEAAFFPGTIDPSNQKEELVLPLIKEQKEKWFLRKREFNEPGRGMLVLSRIPEKIPQLYSGKSEGEFSAVENIRLSNDTLLYWITNPEHNELRVEIKDANDQLLLNDTIRLSRDAKRRERELALPLKPEMNFTGNADRYSKLGFSLRDPIVSQQEVSLPFFTDSLSSVCAFKRADERRYISAHSFLSAAQENYMLIFPEGSISDVFGGKNVQDTVRFKVHKEEFYGKLLLQFSPGSYSGLILQLVNDRNVVLTEKNISTAGVIEFPNLRPGNYRLRIIVDSNKDGKWSMGELFARIPPETVLVYPSIITIRSNWDFEVEWKLD